MITCWLMHWQTSHLAGSQNAAEMAECLLVIQHNGRVCGHTCVYVCVLCVGVCLCVYLWLNLLVRLAFCAFCMFLWVMHFAGIRTWACMCVCVCVFRVITVFCLFLECLSLFVEEATFLSKSKLSWRNCLWTVWKECVFVRLSFFVCVRVLYSWVCVCPRERAIKGAVWWRDCIKGVREETRVAGSWEGSMWGWTGGWCRCLILPQPWAFYIPSISLLSTSAWGCWGM